MDERRFFRPDFDELEEYVPVKPLDVLAREIGVPVGQLVKLDANENLYGAPPEVYEAIAAADLHIYPDPGQAALRAAIAEYIGVSAEQVVGGTGADDLIDLVFRLTAPTAVAVPTPAFGMYRFLAGLNGAECVEVPRREGFALDVAGVAEAVAAGASVVFVTSPNNPTGNALTRAEAQALCRMDALVVVDEAYIEFGGETAVPLVADYPNLVVLRTFSKWAGLAGLRVGYSISTRAIADALTRIKQPYNVNVAADAAARAAIEHRATIFETVRCIVAERGRLTSELATLPWLEPLPSQANFVLSRVRGGYSARKVVETLRAKGILVRHYDRADLANYIRVSVGRPQDTDRLLAALWEMEAA